MFQRIAAQNKNTQNVNPLSEQIQKSETSNFDLKSFELPAQIVNRKEPNPDLGDKNDVGLGLADAASAILADETEASDAGGADLLVATSPIGNPFQGVGTHGTAIVHGYRFDLGFFRTEEKERLG